MPETAIIIGAGPAGLTAAYQMLKTTDIIPIVIEKENFVGGISRTVNHNGNRIDIGGHRFFSKSREVMNLWQQLMPVQGYSSIDDLILGNKKPLSVGGPDPQKDDKVLLIRSRVSRILYLRKFFDYPISLKLQTFLNLGMINTVRAGISYIKAQIIKHDEKTLEDFMINRFGSALYQMFFKDYTCKVWGRYPNQISADWGAQRIKGLSLSKALIFMLKKPFMNKELGQSNVETSLIELFSYPKKGPGQFWELMADEIVKAGGEIHYNCEVIGININDNKIESVSVRSKNNITLLKGDHFISSMPIKDFVSSLNCKVPARVKDIALQLPYRDFITVGLLVNKLKIKNSSKIKTVGDIIPDCWIYVQEPDVKIGRVQIFNNWSPYMVKDFENTVWIGLEYFCKEGDEMWDKSDSDFIDLAIEEAEKIGLIYPDSVLDSVRINVQKAYPAYFGTYKDFHIVREYLDAISNMICIGRNGQHRYNNMDHSMMTAIEAVKILHEKYRDKSVIWDINTEQDYHEGHTN